jgi:hypothetical protein
VVGFPSCPGRGIDRSSERVVVVRFLLARYNALNKYPIIFVRSFIWLGEDNSAPEIPEPVSRHLCVNGGVRNILVAKPMLQGPGVVAVIGQLEPAGMAQHMRVNGEWHPRSLAKPLDELVEANGSHGTTTFGYEHKAGLWAFPLQSTQGPDFIPPHGMDVWCPVLVTANVQASSVSFPSGLK